MDSLFWSTVPYSIRPHMLHAARASDSGSYILFNSGPEFLSNGGGGGKSQSLTKLARI